MRKQYVLSVQRYSSVKLPKLTDVCMWRVGRGEQVCARPPPYKRLQNLATLRSYIFVSVQQIRLRLYNFSNFKAFFPSVSLGCPCQKKYPFGQRLPARIGCYREIPPPPTPPSRYKIREFKNKHTNTRHVKACLA